MGGWGESSVPQLCIWYSNQNKTKKNLLGDTVIGCSKKEELRGFVILIGHHILYIYAFQSSILEEKGLNCNGQKKLFCF